MSWFAWAFATNAKKKIQKTAPTRDTNVEWKENGRREQEDGGEQKKNENISQQQQQLRDQALERAAHEQMSEKQGRLKLHDS